MAANGRTKSASSVDVAVAQHPGASVVLKPEEFSAILAFLEERGAMLEVFRKSLDFISMAEVFWTMCQENGEHSPQAVLARGKLFTLIHTCHKEGLKKRLIEVRDKLDRSEAAYEKALARAGKS